MLGHHNSRNLIFFFFLLPSSSLSFFLLLWWVTVLFLLRFWKKIAQGGGTPIRPPPLNTPFTLYFNGSPDYKNIKIKLHKNAFNKNNYSGHAEYFLHFVWKSRLFLQEGVNPPLIANMSAKKLIFFTPSLTKHISEQNVSTTKHIRTKRIHHKTYLNKTYPPQSISKQNVSTTKYIRTKHIHHKTYYPNKTYPP